MVGGRSARAAIATLALACVLSACQTGSMQVPATLSDVEQDNIERLQAALAGAVGRARISLGPEDLSRSTSVSVQPPPPGPLETRSLARPTVFDLVHDTTSGTCLAINRDTGEATPLPGVRCTPG